MLYILYGADDFSLREALENIKRGLGDPQVLSLNTSVLEGSKLSWERLRNICDTVPFMAAQRLVIVEGLLGRLETRGSRKSAVVGPVLDEEWQEMADYISRMPPSTVLVLVEGNIGAGNPLLKKLLPGATVKSFPLLKGVDLYRWIEGKVAKEGGKISGAAVRLLAGLVGENLWVLASEIDKLLLYARGRRIEEGDVQAVVAYAREANVFAVVDAIVEGHPSVAMKQMHQLLQEGAGAPYLLTMLTRQLRLIVQARELASERLDQFEMRQRLGVSANYPLYKLVTQAKAYSEKRLVEVYHQLLETDLAIKTGRQGEELALDLLVAELCQKSPAPSPLP